MFLIISITKKSYSTEKNNFLISTSHPMASKIGKEILNNGGNAMDAVVAVQMALNLLEPESSGIGGGAFLLYYNKNNSKLYFYDGRETAPANIKKEFFLDKEGNVLKFYDIAVGGLAIGVPGLVSLLDIAHKKHGSLNWSSLFVPSINLSKKGFKNSDKLNKAITKDKFLYLFPESKDYFYQNNKPKKKEKIIKNANFLNTLNIISLKRSKGFYEGELAKDIVNSVKNSPIKNGYIELNDLKSYKAKQRNPLCGKYKKYKICSAAPPSAGGFSILQILGILEEFDLSKNKIKENIHLILEAAKFSYNDRYKYLGDPDFSSIKINKLLSKKYLKNISNEISKNKIRDFTYNSQNETYIPTSTTHFSIIDKYGNIASITSSIENTFGSRIMTNGFLLNNQLSDFNFKIKNNLYKNNIIEPLKRPLSSMSPTIIFDENNNIRMVIGSPGGKSIIMYVVKTIIAVLDWEMSIEEAVNFPNFSIYKNKILIEKDNFDKDFKEYLLNLGHLVVEKELNSGLNGFEIKDKIIYGAADKRRNGLFIHN